MEEKIPELEKRENGDYENEPLLEYVVRLANYWWPELYEVTEEGAVYGESSVPTQFVHYLSRGEIDTSMETAYLEHENVKDTLIALDLDKYKFWYLCLMLKDVVMGFTENTHPKALCPREELKAFVQEIENLEPKYNKDVYMFCGNKHAAELTLQVKEEGKKKGHTFTIQSPKTLFYMGVAVHHFLNNYPKPALPQISDLDGSSCENLFSNETATEKEIWKVALFHKYLNWFLEEHLKGKTPSKELEREITLSNGKKSMATLKVKTSRQKLVSRMIYVMGISENKKYNDLKSDILKNNLKGEYKDPEPQNENSRYNAF